MNSNILLIMADQWAAKNLGCYGCALPGVSPHLDALARRGRRFDRFYANVPVCGPSRACIFTGRSPAATGVYHNNIEITPATPLFTQHLRAQGYRTWGIGKFHFSPMQEFPPASFEGLGWDEVQITEDPKHGPYLDWVRQDHPEYYEVALAMSWPMPYLDAYPPDSADLRAPWRAAYDQYLAPQKRPPFRPIFYPSPLPRELHQSRWIADRAIEQLENHDGQTPFFGFVSFVDPHDPYDPPAPYAQMFAPDQVPPSVPREWTDAWSARDYRKFRDGMFEISDFSDEDWAQLRAFYFGSCRMVDDEIGRVLAALQARGLDENTTVIFLTDHGDLIGDHGLLMKGPWHYDACVRCPLIISGPTIAPGADAQLRCTLDIAPTIYEICGLQTPDLEGRSVTQASTWNEIALETNASYVNARGGCRTLISADNWRLTLFGDEDYGELFDLTGDPDEQNNRFTDPLCAARRGQMAERLVAAMARQIYPFPRGEWAQM